MVCHLSVLCLIFYCYCVNAAVFYTDSYEQKSLLVKVGEENMNRFRSQILNLLGLRKPTSDVRVGDMFASHFMSELYQKVSEIESDDLFNPNFRFLNQRTDGVEFDFGKIKLESRVSDTIISFVPKKIVNKRDNFNTHILEFEMAVEEFQKFQLVSVELYFIIEMDRRSLPLKSWNIIVEGFGENQLFSLKTNDFSSNSNLIFFSLGIKRFFEALLAHPTTDQKLTIAFSNLNGHNEAIVIPKIHCFGVGFFVEGDHEIMKRMKRSFSFEIEENWSGGKNKESSNENANSLNATNIKNGSPANPKIVAAAEEELSNEIDDTFLASMLDSSVPSEPNVPSVLSNLLCVSTSDDFDTNRSSGRFNSEKRSTSRQCKVRSLYVDFKDLGWDSWVIAPTGYQADYCDGDCSFPLDSSTNPTNHAIVQTLVNLFDEKRTQPAKCAPISMKSQNLLFFNEQKNIVMRRYHNMRVKQCGCR